MLDFEIQLRDPSGPDGARVSARAWGLAADGAMCLDEAERERIAAWFLAHFDDCPAGDDGTLTQEEVGERLFDALFYPALRDLWRARPPGVRVRLVLSWAPGAPALAQLAALPWELLYDGQRGVFLADADTAIVRRLEGPPCFTSHAMTPPWRLVVASADVDPEAALQADDELVLLRAAAVRHGACGLDWLARGALSGVQITVCHPAALTRLRLALQERATDILHVIAHGGWDDRRQEGAVLLAPEAGGSHAFAQPVGAEAFAALVAGTGVRLVVLSVCESSRVAPGRRAAAASLASALVRGGVPTVVALQSRLEARSATAFAGEFYARLLAGSAVDVALHEARLALRALTPGPDWAVPTLYLRTPADPPPVARRRPTRVQALLLALDGCLTACLALWVAFLVPGGLDVVSARDAHWATALSVAGVAVGVLWGAVQRFVCRTRQAPRGLWRALGALAGCLVMAWPLQYLWGAPRWDDTSEAATHALPPAVHPTSEGPTSLAYCARREPQSVPASFTCDLSCEHRTAAVTVRVADVFALTPAAGGSETGLYVLRLETTWPARPDRLLYSRVTFGVRRGAEMTLHDAWPQSINAPVPALGSLSVDVDARFTYVPPHSCAIPISANAQPLSQQNQGDWGSWSAPRAGAAGRVSAYALVRLLPGTRHTRLGVRCRATLVQALFGREIDRHTTEGQNGELALSLGPS